MVSPRFKPRQVAASAFFLALLLPTGAVASCGDLLPAAAPSALQKRPIRAEDLIELRDIGDPDASHFGLPSPLAVSPDNHRLAFIIVRADLSSNGYCRGVVVANLEDHAILLIDEGGEPIPQLDIQRGYYVQTGGSVVAVPVWSPDGRSIAFLKRLAGSTQAWVARSDGSGGRQITNSPVDVEEVGWSADGKRLLYAARTDRVAADAAVDAEGRSGWLYDDRISPDLSPRPQSRAATSRPVFSIELASGAVGPADPEDEARMPAEGAAGVPRIPDAKNAAGRRAWAESTGPSPLAPRVVTAMSAAGKPVRCSDPACKDGIIDIWWSPDGSTILFLRREGWANGQMALYRWNPDRGLPGRVLRTSDVLQGCVQAAAALACLRESARTPRRLIVIDTATGATRPIFDPNPQFANIELGVVRRLLWRNDLGLEAWGDLVLPPGYRSGTRLPLIVVQYHSDGFLRGGTGDEYPIFLLAARGFAVLSTERPTFFAAALPKLRTWYEINSANQKDWSERRSLLSSVLTGVDRAIAEGIADPSRIGITGLSDGASTVAFALINSRKFAAAAISTCCLEPKTVMSYGGIAWADWLRGMGYPPGSEGAPAFWRPMSLSLNAKAIDTPLLMQLADSEYLLALEAFAALREHDKPVEMYVFPGEYHNKWQPLHRLAVYRRNVDWFRFWLQGFEDPDPVKAPQYERWRVLRSKGSAAASRSD